MQCNVMHCDARTGQAMRVKRDQPCLIQFEPQIELMERGLVLSPVLMDGYL
jgi:hypothetical protein